MWCLCSVCGCVCLGFELHLGLNLRILIDCLIPPPQKKRKIMINGIGENRKNEIKGSKVESEELDWKSK